MAAGFVNKSGNDSNDGLTEATAKLTVGAALSASLSPITVQTAVYSESLGFLGAPILIADGVVEFDGENTLSALITGAALAMEFQGFTVRNYVGDAVETRGTVSDCRFEDCGAGLFSDSTGPTAERCWFVGCTIGINGKRGFNIKSCTFVGNTTALEKVGTSSGGLTVQNCIFQSNTVHIDVTTGFYSTSSNGNDINFATGKCIIGGVDKLTLSDWQASVGADGNSISANPKFNDEDKRSFGLSADSPCLFSGLLSIADRIQGAFNVKLPPDGDGVVEGTSLNHNTSIWNGATLSGIVQNSSGNYILASGVEVGTATFAFVFPTAINIGRVFLTQKIFYPLAVLDFDNIVPSGAPNRLTYRGRFSPDDVPTFGPFIEFEPVDNIAQSGVKQAEFEVTFRKNGQA